MTKPFEINPVRVLSTESIFAQTDDFGRIIEKSMTRIWEKINNKEVENADDLLRDPYVERIASETEIRTGLKVRIVTNRLMAAVLPFYSNVNHIFIQDWLRGNLTIRDQKRLLSTMNGKKGTVNLEKAKVSGIFAEYTQTVFMNFYELVKRFEMTPREMTAVYLHEIGHAFHACDMSNRTDAVNQVLANIARNISDNQKGDFEYIYKEIEKITPDNAKAAADAIVNGDRVVAGATFFKAAIGMVKSQMQYGHYNNTSFEQMADNFASRFGYGRDLVLALDKLMALSPEKNMAMFFLVQLIHIGTTANIIAMVFMAITGTSVFAVAYAIFLKIVWAMIFREDNLDYTYDKLKIRYLRVRQDAVDQLKDTGADPKFVKDLLEKIATMDEVIKETRNVRFLQNIISNFLFTGARETAKSIDNQQLMEMLASNDLFVQSASIRYSAESLNYKVGDSGIAGKGAFASKK